jgi:hypothetical protein
MHPIFEQKGTAPKRPQSMSRYKSPTEAVCRGASLLSSSSVAGLLRDVTFVAKSAVLIADVKSIQLHKLTRIT